MFVRFESEGIGTGAERIRRLFLVFFFRSERCESCGRAGVVCDIIVFVDETGLCNGSCYY